MKIIRYIIAFIYRVFANIKGYKIPLLKDYYDEDETKRKTPRRETEM